MLQSCRLFIYFILLITYLLHSYCIESNIIKLTSLNFHPNSQSNDWVENIFGNRSLYLYRTAQKQVLDWHPIDDEEIYNSSLYIRNKISSFYEPNDIKCSLEILGYIEVDKIEEFTLGSKARGPLMGLSTMNYSLSDSELLCYYRALYENWRAETERTRPNFWSLIFYCPINNIDKCNAIDSISSDNSKSLTLSINLKGITASYTSTVHNDVKVANITKDSNPKIGICLAIPYSSSDPDKIVANGAMLYTWIQYYLKLGYHVFVYDRGGMNHNFIYPKDARFNNYDKLIYNNYTIRELLKPNEKVVYDNTEILVDHTQIRFGKTRQIRQALQGFDKVLTLTKCRFDARSQHNIHDIIVADFDEFLYCPSARQSTVSAQATYILNLINKAKSKGYEQITLPQRILLNTSISTKDCLINKALHLTSQNITKSVDLFKCFAPYQYGIGGHSIKSIHLGYKCPLTGYHQACPTASPRAYECNCTNLAIKSDECAFIHLSSNPADYIKGVGRYSETQLTFVKNEINELYKMFESSNWF